MGNFFRKLIRSIDGMALMEFAFVLPPMILLSMGTIELGRYSLIKMKIDKASYTMGNLVTQAQPATLEYSNDCEQRLISSGYSRESANTDFSQYTKILSPYGNPEKQVVMITSLTRNGSTFTINWQISGAGTLTTDVSSDITHTGPQNVCCHNQPATLTGDVATQLMALPDGANVTVTEVFFRYHPIMMTALNSVGFGIEETTMKRTSYLYSRNGDMTYLNPDYPPPTPARPPLPAYCPPPPPPPPVCTGSTCSCDSSPNYTCRNSCGEIVNTTSGTPTPIFNSPLCAAYFPPEPEPEPEPAPGPCLPRYFCYDRDNDVAIITFGPIDGWPCTGGCI